MRCLPLLLILILAGCAADPNELTTFILVRHAEKANDGTEDPDLTQEGNTRAEKLSKMFRDTRLVAIYSTNFRRTKYTVAPLAKIHNLEVQEYEAYKPM
jgi:broad specificity phosphatase PhoE